MVQRKVMNKLGIQAESSKNYGASEKRSTTRKLGSQNQDMRNKGGGGEIKKKLMKTRSFKTSDYESLGSSLIRDQSRFKRLSVDVSKGATPKKVSPIKKSDASPNYMKPTSSSDARKESLQVQVSPQSQTTDRNKSPRNLNRTKPSLGPTKVLKKASSLKPVRPSMKKSCTVALYPRLNVSRATCSSTLKDSKFPTYVDLHPGATESQGTSIMKVCPYTYCSLNGHHHTALPPLKHFLSARRRLLKNQKSMKLKGQSSFKLKISGERKKEIDTWQMTLNGDPTILGTDSAGSAISPVIEEVGADFFVEIYAKPRTNISEDDKPKPDFAETPEVLNEESSDGSDEIPPGSSESTDTDMEEIVDSQFNKPISKISGEDNPVHNGGGFITEMDVSMICPAYDERDWEFQVEEDNLLCLIQAELGEINPEFFDESDMVEKTETDVEKVTGGDGSASDATEMDWEEEAASYLDNEIDYYIFSDNGSVSIPAYLPGIEDPNDLAFPDDSVGEFEEAFAEVMMQHEVYEEDTESLTVLFGGEDCEDTSVELDKDEEDDDFKINEGSNECNDLKHNQPDKAEPESSGQYDESTVLGEDEPNGHRDINNSESFKAFAEDPDGVPIEVGGERKENLEQGNYFLQEHAPLGDDNKDDLDQFICTSELTSHADDTEMKQIAVTEDYSSVHEQPNANTQAGTEVNELDDDGLIEGQTTGTVDSQMNHEVTTSNCSPELATQSAGVQDVEERAEDAVSGLHKTQISEISETDQDVHNENQSPDSEKVEPKVSQCDGITEESMCNQEEVIDLNNITPDQSIPPFEECDDKERYKSTSGVNCIGTDDKMQLEDKIMTGTEETCVRVSIEFPQKDDVKNAGRDSSTPQLETYSDLIGKTRRVFKRPIENHEQLRKFNPRAPRYLLPEPNPEAERVDLRHQTMDERKNAEEWMLDYALQQTVTKLAPAQKRRVALLVEAFETVIPIPKCEAHLRHASASFTLARPIQACN